MQRIKLPTDENCYFWALFHQVKNFVALLHLCCDICQMKCVCCEDSCHYYSSLKLGVNIDQGRSVSPTIQLSET